MRGRGKAVLDESAETAAKYTCEDVTFGGMVCGMPAYYLASYSEGDVVPLCLPHLMLEMEQVRLDPVHQQQEWTITYA